MIKNSLNKISMACRLICCLFILGCSSLKKITDYKVQKNIVYKTIDGLNLKANLYLPEKEGLKPAVVVLHGGGWTNKSGDLESVSKDLAAQGFVVFSPDYRLAPKYKFPAALDDVKDAMKWLQSKSSEFQIDKERISGWGYSAGAHLILLVGLDPANGFKAIVGGGTPADLTVWPKSPLVTDFLGDSLEKQPDLWKKASPVNYVRADSPPVFLYHGEWDKIVEVGQMQRMKEALEAKGHKVETHTVSYMGHLATYLLSQESVDLGVNFVKTKIGIKNN